MNENYQSIILQARKCRMALVTYWMFFIITPIILISIYSGLSGFSIAFIAIGLMMAGERGFRLWKRLWKIDS